VAYINLRQKLVLAQLIQDEYAKRGTTDEMFADYASKTAGFKVDTVQVNRMRRQLGIATNRKATSSVRASALEKRIEVLEREVANLKTRNEIAGALRMPTVRYGVAESV
jgi:hypothetical protein